MDDLVNIFRRLSTRGRPDPSSPSTRAQNEPQPSPSPTAPPAPAEADVLLQRLNAHAALEALPEKLKQLISLSLSTSMGDICEQLSLLIESHGYDKILGSLDYWLLLEVGPDVHIAHVFDSQAFRLNDSVTPVVVWDFLNANKQARWSSALSARTIPGQRRSSSPAEFALPGHGKLKLNSIQLLRYHLAVVEPLAERYSAWALAALGCSPATHPLSAAETARVQRALYRLEVFCILCSQRSPCAFTDTDNQVDLLSIFEAWEVEQMLCVYEWVKETVNTVLRRLDTQLSPMLALYGRCVINSQGEVDRELRNYVISCGLCLLRDLCSTEDETKLLNSLLACLGHWRVPPPGQVGSWLDGEDPYNPLTKRAQQLRRERWYTYADARQDQGAPMPFFGDSSADWPPVAWVLLCHHKESSLFGDHVRASYRRWGYAIWDAQRLEDRMVELGIGAGAPSNSGGPQPQQQQQEQPHQPQQPQEPQQPQQEQQDQQQQQDQQHQQHQQQQ